MFIQTEETPNPQTLKFLPGVAVLETGTVDFPSKQAALRSPLAAALFETGAVARVFLGADFISVTKSTTADWSLIKPDVLTTIMEHFVSGRPVIDENAPAERPVAPSTPADESELVTQIKELLETRIRPAVAQDGGDIIYRDFRDGVVYLELQGACSGCPSSSATLKQGVENMLKYYVPEVQSVEAIAS